MAEHIQLRDYQTAIVEAVSLAWSTERRVLAWLPTGGGKTELAAALALAEREAGGHSLFVVERKTLARQAAERFRKYGMLAGIVRGEDTHVRGYEPVTVGTVQSLKFRAEHSAVAGMLARTTLLIIDEAHIVHAHHLALLEAMPQARVLGLTATPLREGLGTVYRGFLKGPSYAALIEQGFLVRPRYFLPHSRTVADGLADVAVASTGDYKDAELSALMRRKTVVGDIVSHWQTKAENRPTIAFCVDRAHARELAEDFHAAGVPSGYVDMATPEDERAELFAAFRAGTIRVLCSVFVLAIGFDEPCAACVILARPTLSLSLHIQQLGRGLRPFAGKSDCLVLDHACNVARHGRVEHFEPPALEALGKHSDRKKRSEPVHDIRPCGNCGAALDPGQFECPECGHTIRRPNRVDFIDGELIESGEALRAVSPFDPETVRHVYAELRWVAKERGYKNGWAYMKTLDRFQLQSLPESMKRNLLPWSLRNAPPCPPSGATMRWLKSRTIAWAKSQGAR